MFDEDELRIGGSVSRFGKPQEHCGVDDNPEVPPNYIHRGKPIYVVCVGSYINPDQIRWLIENAHTCTLYSHRKIWGSSTLETYDIPDLVAALNTGKERFDIDRYTVAYVKFTGADKAVEFKMLFAETYVE